jgi:hypothetical protein
VQSRPGSRGRLTLPSPVDPPFDPVARGARVRVEDQSGEAILDDTVPGGAFDPATSVGWRHDPDRGRWVFTHPGRHGIRQLILKRDASAQNDVRFMAKVHLPSASVPTTERLPLRGTMVVEAPVAREGQCGEIAFGGGQDAIACPVHEAARLVCR